MVKGITKQVIVVSSPHEDIFDQAIFILKDKTVDFPDHLLNILPEEKREAAIGVLSHDPRPSYQRKPDRVYGLTFAGFDIRFKVAEDILTVVEVNKS